MSKKLSWRSLRYLRPYRRHAVWNIVFNVLSTVFGILSLLTVKPFLDILFSNTPAPDAVVSGGFIGNIVQYFNSLLLDYIQRYGMKTGLIFVCAVVVATFFLKNLFRYLALYVMAPVRNGIERDIRLAVFDKLLQLPLSYFSEQRKGDLMSRLTADVQEIQWSVLRSLETLVRSPLALLGSLAVMLYISPALTGFSILLIAVVGLVIGRVGKSLRKKSSSAQSSLGRILSHIEEALGGLRIVQGFGAERYQNQRFTQENEEYYQIANRMMQRKDLSSPLTEFLGVAVVVVLLFFGGNLVFAGHFEASTFITFVLMFYNWIEPAKSFATAFYDIQKGSAAAERIQQILDAPRAIEDAPDARPVPAFQTAIQYKNVGFYYNKDIPILNNIELTIPKGKIVALVGPSGAGKSTLVDLLPRFYDVVEGQVLVDGQDIRRCRLADLRAQIGIVSQEAILFNDTVYNNIVFGYEGATPQAVEEAARIAFAHDFIQELENGYQTIIGDRGMKLSGGQRQRITIARAILRNPPILILDEATSALDSESEKWVQKALWTVMRDRTCLVIAHRLSTIQHADEIVVLRDGNIVERGTHAQLIAQEGSYRQWIAMQSGL